MTDTRNDKTPAGAMQHDIPPRKTRKSTIKSALDGAAPSHFVPMPDGLVQVPVARIPHDTLIYRLENGRLIAELHEYMHRHNVSWDKLEQSVEAPETQSLLHGLLMQHAADARGPIFQELKRQKQQIEPLLIDRNGIVINGNRRLAAMRTLLAEDAAACADFADLTVAVLPKDISAADIDFIEAALQMAPETKLGYGWVNRRLKLRRQLTTLELPRDWVRKAYQIEDDAQLDREIAELALVEEYLSTHLGTPDHYEAVADAEAHFAALQTQLAELDAPLRDLWKTIGFAMIEARAKLGQVLLTGFPFEAPTPKHLPTNAPRRFLQEHLAQEPDTEKPDAPLGASEVQDLQQFFSQTGLKDLEPLRDLMALMTDLREEHRIKVEPAAMVKSLRNARAKLDKLSPERLSDTQRSALRSEIGAIQAQAAWLLGEAPDHRFEQSKTTMVKAVSAYLKRWRAMRGRG